jgi:hypothetical protein
MGSPLAGDFVTGVVPRFSQVGPGSSWSSVAILYCWKRLEGIYVQGIHRHPATQQQQQSANSIFTTVCAFLPTAVLSCIQGWQPGLGFAAVRQ